MNLILPKKFLKGRRELRATEKTAKSNQSDQNPKEAVLNSLSMAGIYVDEIKNEINIIIRNYNDGHNHRAECLFIELVDNVNLLVKIFSYSIDIFDKLRIPMEDKQIDQIAKANVELVRALNSLVPAKEKKDFGLISDILKFDLAANLEYWKVSIIPIFLNSLVE
jgi:hypothetical protein